MGLGSRVKGGCSGVEKAEVMGYLGEEHLGEQRNPMAALRELSRVLTGSGVKTLSAMQENVGLIPGLARPPAEGNGAPPQHSPLRNSMDRGARTAHMAAQSQTRQQLKQPPQRPCAGPRGGAHNRSFTFARIKELRLHL